MRKAIQIVAMACLLAVGSYVAANDCESCINFGLNWQTATEQDVRGWLKPTDDVKSGKLSFIKSFVLGWLESTGDVKSGESGFIKSFVLGWLESTGDVKAKDEDGKTPLHYVAQYNDNPAVISILAEAGADLEAGTKDSRYTPLHLAAIGNKNPAIINALVEAGADLEAKDIDGGTPLHCAVDGNDNPAVINILIKHGANKNAENGFNVTPLGLAKMRERTKAINALVKQGAKE